MTEQSKNFLQECFSKEISYKIQDEEESRDEKVINEVVESVEDLLKNATDNAPTAEIKEELTDLRTKLGNAIDVLKEGGVSVSFSIANQKEMEKERELDIPDEIFKYKTMVEHFKSMNNENDFADVSQKQIQDFYEKTIELKEQTKVMLDNNILGEKGKENLSASLSNFKYLENEILKTGYEIDTRSFDEKMEDLDKAVFEALTEIGQKSYYNGEYEITPSSYDDYLSSSDIIETFNEFMEDETHESKSFAEYFEINQYDKTFMEDVIQEHCYIVDSLLSDFKDSDKYDAIVEEYGEKMVDDFIEGLNEEVPYEVTEKAGIHVSLDPIDFVGKDYHINLVLNDKLDGREGTGRDIQTIFSQDNYGFDRSSEEISDMLNNPFTYLIQQQGHSVEEVVEGFHNDVLEKDYDADDFVKSVVNEARYTPNYTQLTVLASMSGKELIDLLDAVAHKDENKAIEVSSDATVGLFDGRYNGCGSDLDVELKKPFTFTADMIDFVQLEGARDKEENIGYTVDSVYGLCGEAWKADITVKDVDDALRKEINSAKEISAETVENVKEEIENFEHEMNDEEIEK